MFRYLTVDTNANVADELHISPNSTSEIYQAFFLGQPLVPYRVLVINLNLITIFCFFHDGNIEMIFISIVSFYSFPDDDSLNNETMNTQIVECLKKELDAMLPSFEEHLRKKYPP